MKPTITTEDYTKLEKGPELTILKRGTEESFTDKLEMYVKVEVPSEDEVSVKVEVEDSKQFSKVIQKTCRKYQIFLFQELSPLMEPPTAVRFNTAPSPNCINDTLTRPNILKRNIISKVIQKTCRKYQIFLF